MQQIVIDGLEITSGQYDVDSDKLIEHSSVITHWLKIRSFKYLDSGNLKTFFFKTLNIF